MTTAQRNAISNPVEGLTIYNTDLKCLDTYNGVRWIACNSIGATDVYNPATGQIWMDRNLGASRVATAFNDAQSYGDLYQWGRGADGHQVRSPASSATNGTSTSTSPGSNFLWVSPAANWYVGNNPNPDDLWQGVNGINNPCPSGYRIPTISEWNTEVSSWSNTSDRRIDAFNSPLKLTVGGGRNGGTASQFDSVNNHGNYWSSTISGTNASYRSIRDIAVYNFTAPRSVGFSVRCIKD